MADIEELFTRINKQAVLQFFPYKYKETFKWVNNYGVGLPDKINTTQTEQSNLLLMKSPLRRRKNKSRTIRSRSLLKKRENETSETNNSIKSEQKLKRAALIIAKNKITLQSNCNLKTKLRDKNESALHDISNCTTLKNIKLKKQSASSIQSTSENMKFQTKNKEKENIAPSFIKHTSTKKNITEKRNIFQNENKSKASITSSFNSNIFQEDTASIIILSDSETEEFNEQIKTPIAQKYLSVPVIGRENIKKRLESSDDENDVIREEFKEITNCSSLRILSPNHNNSCVIFQGESIPFIVLSESETEENENEILLEDQFVEEISEIISKCNINSNSQTNLDVSSSKEPLEVNNHVANSMNSNLHYTQTSTPIKTRLNNSKLSGLALLEKINDDFSTTLPDRNDVNVSTDNMENRGKTYITKKDVVVKDIEKVSNKLLTNTRIRTKVTDKENKKLQKYTKSPMKGSKMKYFSPIIQNKIKSFIPPLSDSKLHTNNIKNTNVIQLQQEEKQKKLLEKKEQAKKKREALLQIKIEEQRKKREEKQLQAQKVREEKKKQAEERLQLIMHIKEEEQKKKAMLIAEKKKFKTYGKRKKQKKINIHNIPLLPTCDCYDSDDPERKVLREYIKPPWAEYGNVTLLKMNQDYLPKKCIKTFFQMPLKKPNLRLLFANTRVQTPN